MLGGDDTFIIIACDGLWDVMSNQDAVNFVNTLLTSSLTSSLQHTAQALVEHALQVIQAHTDIH
jgi:protein phosphatase PTC1